MIVIKYITFACGNCGFHVNYVVRSLQHAGVMEALSSGGLPANIVQGAWAEFPTASCCFTFQGKCLCCSFFLEHPSLSPAFLPAKLLLQDSTQTLFHLGEVLWQSPDSAG